MSELFREKSLETVNSPEDLGDYIRVTTPSVWLALIATVLLLVGLLVWGFIGTLDVKHADGSVSQEHPITFVTN